MTKTEANERAREIFREVNRLHDKIIEEAEAKGTWQTGLDSNNHLFREVDNKAKERLKKLAEMIED